MPLGLGPTELIVIFLIIIVLFGASRIGDLGGALGRGIREFRTSVKDEPAKKEAVEDNKQA